MNSIDDVRRKLNEILAPFNTQAHLIPTEKGLRLGFGIRINKTIFFDVSQLQGLPDDIVQSKLMEMVVDILADISAQIGLEVDRMDKEYRKIKLVTPMV